VTQRPYAYLPPPSLAPQTAVLTCGQREDSLIARAACPTLLPCPGGAASSGAILGDEQGQAGAPFRCLGPGPRPEYDPHTARPTLMLVRDMAEQVHARAVADGCMRGGGGTCVRWSRDQRWQGCGDGARLRDMARSRCVHRGPRQSRAAGLEHLLQELLLGLGWCAGEGHGVGLWWACVSVTSPSPCSGGRPPHVDALVLLQHMCSGNRRRGGGCRGAGGAAQPVAPA